MVRENFPNIDADIHNADWPKRTPDRMEDVEKLDAERESARARKSEELRSAGQEDYVYAENTWANTGGIVCLPRTTAEELASVWRALGTSKTWGELLAALEKGAPEQYVWLKEWWDDGQHDEEAPSLPDEIGEHDSIPGYADGDWPPWPEQLMLELLPEEVVALGDPATSVFNGEFLNLWTEREVEMLAIFDRRGDRCIRDEKLVAEACGVGVKW